MYSSCFMVTLTQHPPITNFLMLDVTSTFGNLQSTPDRLEVIFNIIVLTSGLILVTMLIGNIKVHIHTT